MKNGNETKVMKEFKFYLRVGKKKEYCKKCRPSNFLSTSNQQSAGKMRDCFQPWEDLTWYRQFRARSRITVQFDTMPRFRGRTREVVQIRVYAGFHWRCIVYTVITIQRSRPRQVGQNELAQVRNFSCIHMEKFHTLRGQTQLSVYTHKKSGVRPRHAGSNPTNLRNSSIKRRVRLAAIGAGDLRLHWVAKGGGLADPASWGSTTAI